MSGRDQAELLELVNRLGHDLRSPLTAVRGAATLLLQSYDDLSRERILELLGLIDRRVQVMADRIEDLIAVCYVESGQLKLYIEDFDAGRLLSAAAEPFEREAQPRLEIEEPPGVLVKADFDRSVQVLRALLANAHQFAPPEQPITARVEVLPGPVRFEVIDRGPGVPEPHREVIFGRLWHGEQGGAGLGLYLGRELARAMGGDIGYNPVAGGGSRFWFTLARSG